jgi:hypothetical protein
MNVESTEAVHALKLLESVKRNLTGTRDELQKFSPFFFVERSDRSPEPLDLRGSSRVVVVFSVVLPVFNIDIGQTRNEQFELLFAENGDEFGRDNVMEAYSLKC